MICTVIFVWCLLRQRNGVLNSGPKSANIVSDALEYIKMKRSKDRPKLIGSHIIFFSYNHVNINIIPYGENTKIPFFSF